MPQIPELPNAGALQTGDLLPVVRGGVTSHVAFNGVSAAGINAWPADSGTGQVAQNLDAWLGRTPVRLDRFGAVAQSRTASSPTNHTVALQKVLDYAAGQGLPVVVTPGAWFHAGLVLNPEQVIVGVSRTRAGFKMMPDALQHSFRPVDLLTKNVVLSGFYIDGSADAYNPSNKPVSLAAHNWGDGIYANLSSDAAALVGGFDTDALWSGTNWAISDVLIFRPMRHGLYTAGIGRYRVNQLRVVETYVDGMYLQAQGVLTDCEVFSAGRNGLVSNASAQLMSGLRISYCGTNTQRANGQTTAIQNEWLSAATGAGEVAGGGGCGLQLRATTRMTRIIESTIRDTLGPGLILFGSVDSDLDLRLANVGALFGQSGLGTNIAVNSAVVQMHGAAFGNKVVIEHSDLYAVLSYATSNLLQVLGTTSKGNAVTERYETAQSFPTPKSFVNETEAAWTSRGNTVTLTSVAKR